MPHWTHRAVLDDALVPPSTRSFGLTGGLERWLDRLVRMHAGHQRGGWRVDFRHLHTKSASLSLFKRFAFEMRDTRAASPCRATGSRSNARPADASCWRSRPHSHPQAPVRKLWNRKMFREPMGTCHQEPDPRVIRKRIPIFL